MFSGSEEVVIWEDALEQEVEQHMVEVGITRLGFQRCVRVVQLGQ